MAYGILNDEKIKTLINNAHVERSEMFHAIIKNSFSEVKNLILKPITASQKYATAHH
ncbi:MAG: hypothetical protein V7723_01510 [Sneathiella sp.]|uniref:hypothetical protein n=1 Tax=Sneathiella sp. TaxID=1964365 RepID=UPI0030030B56